MRPQQDRASGGCSGARFRVIVDDEGLSITHAACVFGVLGGRRECGSAVTDNERPIQKLQNVGVVRRDLAAFLLRLGVALRAGIQSLRRSVPASEHTAEASELHVEPVQKLDDMHSAVHQARAEGVRVLVEDEGLPVSAVARLTAVRGRSSPGCTSRRGTAGRRPRRRTGPARGAPGSSAPALSSARARARARRSRLPRSSRRSGRPRIAIGSTPPVRSYGPRRGGPSGPGGHHV